MKKCLCVTALALTIVAVLCGCMRSETKPAATTTPAPAQTQEPTATPVPTTAPEAPNTAEDSVIAPEKGTNDGDVSGKNGVDSGHDSAEQDRQNSTTKDRTDSANGDSAMDDIRRAGEDIGSAAREVGDSVTDAARDMTK